jgi:hypothetical protein
MFRGDVGRMDRIAALGEIRQLSGAEFVMVLRMITQAIRVA